MAWVRAMRVSPKILRSGGVDEPDREVFGKLSKGMQETISRSPEFQSHQKGGTYAEDESASGSGPSFPDDSDIPF